MIGQASRSSRGRRHHPRVSERSKKACSCFRESAVAPPPSLFARRCSSGRHALKPAAVCTGLTVFDELRGIRHLESVQTDLTRTILSQPIKQARELRTVVIVPIAWWWHSPADRPRTMTLGLAPAYVDPRGLAIFDAKHGVQLRTAVEQRPKNAPRHSRLRHRPAGARRRSRPAAGRPAPHRSWRRARRR